MAAKTEFLKDLPAFYKQQTHHGVLFGWVRCYRRLYPSTTVKEVVGAYMKEFEVTEEDLDLMALVTTFNRTNKNFLNAKKTEHKETQEAS